MKDNFSAHSEQYALYRPHYPREIFEYIFSQNDRHELAWDCGTGNGQVARVLADNFKQVIATDISAQQLKNAIQKPNVDYRLESAEETSISKSSVDLITVGQAIHWFNFDRFYIEVNRTLKPEGIIAVFGYPLPNIDSEINEVVKYFYSVTLENYWDPERRFVDERYQTIPFPFVEIESKKFTMDYPWTLDEFSGFLSTWSAVRHYIRKHGDNPVDDVRKALCRIWIEKEKKNVSFELMLRMGRKTNNLSRP